MVSEFTIYTGVKYSSKKKKKHIRYEILSLVHSIRDSALVRKLGASKWLNYFTPAILYFLISYTIGNIN
jgi:hypothetical protein